MYIIGKRRARQISSKPFMFIVGLFLLGAIGSGVGVSRMFVHAAPELSATNVSVQPLWPSSNATVDGRITLRSTVKGLNPDQYDMFWAVDNGQWNRMNADAHNPAVATGIADVSQWQWKKNNAYDITFIARIKATGQSVQSTLTVHTTPTTTPPTTSIAPVTTPAKTASNTSITSLPRMLYLNSASETTQKANALAARMPSQAASLQRLASQPVGEWYGSWNTDVQTDVNTYVSAATAAKQIPLLVAYNIPNRDCGGQSAGGAINDQAYLDWIQKMAHGIGMRPALVVVEPDALAGSDCLSESARQSRLQLLGQAVHILKTTTAANVYLDAGHARWQSAAMMAARLKTAHIDQADGFSLNVSNFVSTNENITYGTQLSKLVGGKHFVIDTSRNGNGATSAAQWCNPPGRALGQSPTLQTNNTLVDGYLWVRGPGGSDGQCGPAVDGVSPPGAGVWWTEYLLELMRNAGW